MPRQDNFIKKVIGLLLSFRGLFPLSVAVLYLVLGKLAPEKTGLAFGIGVNLFIHLLVPMSLVFCFMVALNLFLTPPRFEKYAKSNAGIKGNLVAAIAGILSSGPIFAWYPILKELRDQGAAPSLMAVFLVNRAVKPALIPLMISLFGWVFVLLFTFLTVAASFCVGFCMDYLLPVAVKNSMQKR